MLRAIRTPLRGGLACIALLGLALALPQAAATFGSGHGGHGSSVAEQLLVHARVVEPRAPAGSEAAGVEALAALRAADSQKEVETRLATALEMGAAEILASEDKAVPYNFPLHLTLPDDTKLEVRPLKRTDSRRELRTRVRQRNGSEEKVRIVEVPLDRTTALPTGGLVIPLDSGGRLLAIQVEIHGN